tara:strand:+ start:292 stop:438 length:147 start_codon:yes stop_codon:yes gene_type:complete
MQAAIFGLAVRPVQRWLPTGRRAHNGMLIFLLKVENKQKQKRKKTGKK